MERDERTLLALADVLVYPGDDIAQVYGRVEHELRERAPALADAVVALGAALETRGLDELQEEFTRTFDLNPASTLDIGWHLFGESYKRGAFLVGLREDMRAYGVEEGCELPDHLPSVLRLITRLPEGEHADLLWESCVLPALARVAGVLAGRGNEPFAGLVLTASALFGPGTPLEKPHLPVVKEDAA
ncbi:MAG: molecular chaperone TorD family protein [Sandaracinaceae bacterium]|nr:molecular chaperone TorD family protein [Sandaracinaceae bacterium]